MESDVPQKYFYNKPFEILDMDKRVCGELKVNTFEMNRRIYNPEFKCCTLTCINGGYQEKKVLDHGAPRKLTAIEYERLQGLPDNYTNIKIGNRNLSYSKRCSLMGNGWTVNYNRDVEIFPVLQAMFEKIMGECPYKSPTDMGVNMAGNCIVDDEVCKEAARQEIIRRYYKSMEALVRGAGREEEVFKIELLLKQAHVTIEDRKVVPAALKREEETGAPAAALELPDGRIVTGKTSELLGASSALLLNALKELAGIDHDKHVISPEALKPKL